MVFPWWFHLDVYSQVRVRSVHQCVSSRWDTTRIDVEQLEIYCLLNPDVKRQQNHHSQTCTLHATDDTTASVVRREQAKVALLVNLPDTTENLCNIRKS